MVDKLKLIGFTEIEAKVYIHILKNPGDNGTQMSKILGVSRSACYNALSKLESENVIKLLPSDIDRKNYKAYNPNLMLNEKKYILDKTINELNIELLDLYEKFSYEEVYNIKRYENALYKIFDMIETAETVLHIIGQIDDKEVNENINKREDIIKIEIENKNENEFILLKDNTEIIIIENDKSIYTKNKIIINQISNRIRLEMEKKTQCL